MVGFSPILSVLTVVGLLVRLCFMNKSSAAVLGGEGKKSARSYRAPALEKGLDILELTAGLSRPIALTAIAEKLGRTKQAILRVVASLCERGYLIRGTSQRYRVSIKLFELGAKHASIQTLVARAMPAMATKSVKCITK